MNKYFLMKLIETAGETGFRGRKRLQKVVFFAQEDGLELEAEYGLHRYGPYSQEVSEACAELKTLGLIKEDTTPSARGAVEYSYKLTPEGVTAIGYTENNSPATSIEKYISHLDEVRELISTDLWHLELGSTILYYFNKSADWNLALSNACEFKNVSAESTSSKAALALAKKHVHPDH